MPEAIYDIEADGLLDSVTKIHCLTYGIYDENGILQLRTTSDYEEMKKFFLDPNYQRVGHNIVLYDERVVEKILGIKPVGRPIDTLALSWVLAHYRKKHSLESYDPDTKVHVDDWQNLSQEKYEERCEKDVEINAALWLRAKNYLRLIYQDNLEDIPRYLDYLYFLLDSIRVQEDNPLKLDIIRAHNLLDNLKAEKESKISSLAKAMPKVPIKKVAKYPRGIKLSETEFYIEGDFFFEYYKSMGYPVTEIEITKVKGYEDPNPNSPEQKKSWLFSLGWKPKHFKETTNKQGEVNKIPQIASKNGDGVCESVKELYTVEPRVELLDGLSILSHRIGVVEGLLRDQKDGYIYGSIAGLTNTLRMRHKYLVNLPGLFKPYGKEIRGLLIAEEGEFLCGSDCSALEDSTKQHYIYPYDPDYVNEMRTPGFDPHLRVAELAGLLTPQQVEDHKAGRANYKKERSLAKVVNFSGVYGAGAPKIADAAGITLQEAEKLHTTYWTLNWAVKEVAASFKVRRIGKFMWLQNPVNKFWYSLREDKDRFSTGNQGLGSYFFNIWLKHVRKAGIIVNFQYHDEILFNSKGRSKEEIEMILHDCIKAANEEVKLNVNIDISIDMGQNYADCH